MPDIDCTGCKKSLPPEAFHRNRSRPSGRASRCKSCVKTRRQGSQLPASFDLAVLLADRLDRPEKRALWEHLRPDAIADQLFTTKEN